MRGRDGREASDWTWPKAEEWLQRRFTEKAGLLAANLDYNAAGKEDRIDPAASHNGLCSQGLMKHAARIRANLLPVIVAGTSVADR